MANSESGQQDPASAQRKGRRAYPPTGAHTRPSLAIPLVVGLVFVALLIGVIVSGGAAMRRPGQLSAANVGPGRDPNPVSTALPLATQPIPYPQVPRISLERAQSLLSLGQAVLVDVRSRVSYDKSHAAGALSLPEDEMEAQVDGLPSDRALILYCT